MDSAHPFGSNTKLRFWLCMMGLTTGGNYEAIDILMTERDIEVVFIFLSATEGSPSGGVHKKFQNVIIR